MADGWILIHRKLFDNPLWIGEEFTKGQAWVDLLLLANYEKGEIFVKGKTISIDIGQVGYSELKLSSRWMWSRGKTRRFLMRLVTEHRIEHETVHGSSVITICNYRHYQKKPGSDGTHNEHKTVHETDKKQDTIKETKQTKETKEEVLLLFDEFWNLFPRRRRGNKTKAETSYRKILSENRATENEILNGVKNYAKSQEVANGYAKGCAAWLNDDRWTDQIADNFSGSSQGGQRNGGHKEPPSRAAAHGRAIDRMETQ